MMTVFAVDEVIGIPIGIRVRVRLTSYHNFHAGVSNNQFRSPACGVIQGLLQYGNALEEVLDLPLLVHVNQEVSVSLPVGVAQWLNDNVREGEVDYAAHLYVGCLPRAWANKEIITQTFFFYLRFEKSQVLT